MKHKQSTSERNLHFEETNTFRSTFIKHIHKISKALKQTVSKRPFSDTQRPVEIETGLTNTDRGATDRFVVKSLANCHLVLFSHSHFL
jgi:hypothetical protein